MTTESTQITKYQVNPSFVDKVNKASRKNGSKIRVSYKESEGSNNNWQVLARAMLREAAPHMNIKGMEICVGVASRFSISARQKQAVVAIARQHCPKVFNNILLEQE